MPEPIRVFISYSWDSDSHKEWVAKLAAALDQEDDLHVIFDQWDLKPGMDIPMFMDTGLNADRILVICTSNYVERTRARKHGAGYEGGIISAHLAEDMAQDTFIPVMREGKDRPLYLKGKLYADFRDDSFFDRQVDELLSAIRGSSVVNRPTKRTRRLDEAATPTQRQGAVNAIGQPPMLDAEVRRINQPSQEPETASVPQDLHYVQVVKILEQVTVANLQERALRDESFEALNHRYATPPNSTERDRVYSRYVKALKRLSVESDLAPRALRRLLELDAVDITDDVFAARIVNQETTFIAAVDFAMIGNDASSKRYLSWVLEACLRTGDSLRLERFIELLRERHASVELRLGSVEISPDIRIQVQKELLTTYNSLLHASFNRGLEMYRTITE